MDENPDVSGYDVIPAGFPAWYRELSVTDTFTGSADFPERPLFRSVPLTGICRGYLQESDEKNEFYKKNTAVASRVTAPSFRIRKRRTDHGQTRNGQQLQTDQSGRSKRNDEA